MTDVEAADLLRIAPNLSMDASEAATETFGILTTKGGGKTYLAGKIAEELYGHGCPVIILDPVGNWWPIRLDASGQGLGLPFMVIGGDHADVPLDPKKGAEIARYLVEHDGSAVIDLSALSKTKRKEFVADFCEALMIATRTNKSPRMVIFEEVQNFAPQRLTRGEERMLGAVTDVVRIGRNYAVGCMMLSQRPQSVNKEVLNMVECLFIGKMRAAQDRKAIKDWVTEQGVDNKAELAELPSLKSGDFYCWSPSWLEIFVKIRAFPKKTFDGSSTPKLGRQSERREIVPLDVRAFIEMLGGSTDQHSSDEVPGGRGAGKVPKPTKPTKPTKSTHMAKPTEPTKAFDNGVQEILDRASARVAELEAENAKLLRDQERADRLIAEYEADVGIGDDLHSELTEVIDRARTAIENFVSRRQKLMAGMPVLSENAYVSPLLEAPTRRRSKKQPAATAPVPAPVKKAARMAGAAATPDYTLSLLDAIVAYGPVTRLELSILAIKSRTSSTFAGAIHSLADDGYITETSGKLESTPLGQRRAPGAPIKKGRTLYDLWMRQLRDYDRETFKALEPKGTELTRKELAESAGHSVTSSTFAKSVHRLINAGLCEEVSRKIRVTSFVRKAFGL